MSYTLNFGFRSFENIVRNARFRAPATGGALLIGSPVAIDSANAGRLKQAGAAEVPGAGKGVLVYEHIQVKGVDPLLSVPTDFTTVPVGDYAQIVSGIGVKVWLKGDLLDVGVDPGALAPGDGLVPNASGQFAVTGVGESSWLIVEQSNASTGVVEARFTF